MVVGSLELLPVPDAVGLLGDYDELYPGVPAEAWEPYRELYPELYAGETWRLPCNCFLIRTPDFTILADTGVGPPGLWDWTAEDESGLPEALAAHGVGRDGVDIVFLTHLHIDHLGWNSDLEAFARTQADRPHIRRCVEPLVDRFERVTGDVELAKGVTAFVAPGHYPGHMALRAESEGRTALLIADMAVHPALLDEPDWVYVSDGDPAVCAETRRRLLPELVDRDLLVACGHYPGSGLGRVVTREGRVVWEEALA